MTADPAPPRRVGFVVHHSSDKAAALKPTLVETVEGAGASVVTEPPYDLLVVLGGDGTVLHGIRLAGFDGAPVLGINTGRLGFLTESGPENAIDAVKSALGGRFHLERRSTVHGVIERADGGVEDLGEGINEISVERAVGGKVINMSLAIAGQPFCGFSADGVIVATPTGSTAYSFSMRGPVVSPDLDCLVVVAVGAHTLFDRPVVISRDSKVAVRLSDRGDGIVVIDGRPRATLKPNDTLTCRTGDSSVNLVRLGPDTHFQRFAQRFGLPPYSG